MSDNKRKKVTLNSTQTLNSKNLGRSRKYNFFYSECSGFATRPLPRDGSAEGRHSAETQQSSPTPSSGSEIKNYGRSSTSNDAMERLRCRTIQK